MKIPVNVNSMLAALLARCASAASGARRASLLNQTLPTASTIPMARVAMAMQRICLGDVMFVSFILFVSVPAQQERYRINTDGADALPPNGKRQPREAAVADA